MSVEFDGAAKVLLLLGVIGYGIAVLALSRVQDRRLRTGCLVFVGSLFVAVVARAMLGISVSGAERVWSEVSFVATVTIPFSYLFLVLLTASNRVQGWPGVFLLYPLILFLQWGGNAVLSMAPAFLVLSVVPLLSGVWIVLAARRQTTQWPAEHIGFAGLVLLAGWVMAALGLGGSQDLGVICGFPATVLLVVGICYKKVIDLAHLLREMLLLLSTALLLGPLFWLFLIPGSGGQTPLGVAVITLVTATVGYLAMAWVERTVNRVVSTDDTDYRQALSSMGYAISSVLNLDQISAELLQQICRALKLPHACLLLLDKDGDYVLSRCYGIRVLDKSDVRLRKNAITDVLEKDGKPLKRGEFSRFFGLPRLGPNETKAFVRLETEIIVPIRLRGYLIGMLLLPAKMGGSKDYSGKDLDLLDTAVNQIAAALENARLYHEAKLQAVTDGLTRLYNHHYFHEMLEQEIGRAARNDKDVSVLMIDVDYFKAYNDRFGHIAGDEALVVIAEVISKQIRPYDIAARYGGEEFAAILPETSALEAWQVSCRLREAVEQETRIRLCDKLQGARGLTVSIGIAHYPDQARTAREIVMIADKALYDAKESGRNQVSLIEGNTDSAG